MKNEVILSLADKYSKSPAQILLRHLIQKNIVVIPKSIDEKRINENLNIFDFELDDYELDILNEQPQGGRFFQLNFMAGHPEDPWKNERGEKERF